MSTSSFTVIDKGGVVKSTPGATTSFEQVQIVGADSRFTANLLENWVATAATKNDGTAKLIADGHNVDLTRALGSYGWTVSNEGNSAKVTITGSVQNDTLTGGAGADTLNGGAGRDFLDGGDGDDSLTGGAGSDIFSCSAGNDTITDLGRDGDALNVNLYGNVRATLAADWTADLHSNNDGKVTLIANGHSVTLSGNNANGGEHVDGTAGWTITNAGNSKAVTFVGSLNNDTLIGGAGRDFLAGGAGDDSLTGGLGSDTFSCSAGEDTITDLGLGGDALNVNLYGSVTATLAADWAASQYSNNDGIVTLLANGHSVTLSSKDGFYNVGGVAGWTITNAGNSKAVSFVGSLNDDILIGGAGNDTIEGGAGKNQLYGGKGNDTIYGQGAQGELLSGDDGNDRLYAGDNGARLDGGAGNDWLKGGKSADIFAFQIKGGWGNDTIVDFQHGVDKLRFIGSQNDALSVVESHVGGDTVLTYGQSSITLVGIQVDTIKSDFIWGVG